MYFLRQYFVPDVCLLWKLSMLSVIQWTELFASENLFLKVRAVSSKVGVVFLDYEQHFSPQVVVDVQSAIECHVWKPLLSFA